MNDIPSASSRTLTGRNAVVTGGASGIGRAVAARLVTDGAQVVVLDRDEAGAKQAAEDIGGCYLLADLSDGASIDAVGLGTDVRADILVYNAGVLAQLSEHSNRRLFDLAQGIVSSRDIPQV